MTPKGFLVWFIMLLVAFIIVGLLFIQIGKSTIELMGDDKIIYIQI